MRRWAVWVCVVVALAASGCSTVDASRGHSGPDPARLLSYTSCSQLLSQVKAQALSEVGPNGLPDPPAAFGSSSVGTPERLAAAASSTAAGVANDAAGTDRAASAGVPAYSTTNDQEQGVDEPDLVKTNGQLLVTLRDDPVGIQVASVGAVPRLRGFLSMADTVDPSGMFLVGNDAVVLGSSTSPVPQPRSGNPSQSSGVPNGGGPMIPATPTAPTTDVTVVDLTDPDHPVVAHSFVVKGAEVDARLIAGYVELVVDSAPTLPFVTPTDWSPATSHQALDANRRARSRLRPG